MTAAISSGSAMWTRVGLLLLVLLNQRCIVDCDAASSANDFGFNTSFPGEYQVDTAKAYALEISSSLTNELHLYMRSDNCYQCLFVPAIPGNPPLPGNATMASMLPFSIQTNWPHHFEVRRAIGQNPLREKVVQSFTHEFVDHGVFLIKVSAGVLRDPKAEVVTLREGLRGWVPLVVAGSVYAGLLVCYLVIQVISARGRRGSKGSDNNVISASAALYRPISTNDSSLSAAPITTTTRPRTGGRLASLDTVRGISIGIMIFVNYGGGGYWFFNHSIWNGLTFADMVFPWFIWIMGTSMALSFRAQASNGSLYTLQGFWKILKRCIILFWLGLFLNNGYDIPNWRIPGVLQRFAVSYGAVAVIALAVPEFGRGGYLRPARRDGFGATSVQGTGDDEGIRTGLFADIVPYIWQWIVATLLLVVYLAITFGLDVPGCGRGYLGPGGLADDGKYVNCTGGAAGYVDNQIFTTNHIYQSPTCQETYETGAYDPEGTLGYLTSIWLCFLGLQCGRTLVHYREDKSRIVRLLIWGLFFSLLAGVLCNFKKNGGWIPISKNLWSPSFVFAAGGTAFILLALCYYLIDVKGWWRGQPFCYVGMNPILIYMAHEILNPYFPFSYTTGTDAMNTHAGQLTENLIGATCWFVIAWRFYENKFFVSV